MESKKKSLINSSFDTWIGNYPESYNQLDKDRFYSLVRLVCIYGRKTRNQNWLRNKINKTNHNLNEEDIKYYCNLFQTLLDFCKYGRS